MYIYPAIDLSSGRVVRLRQGDYDDMTVYGDDPISVAIDFHDKGAKFLHIVDLDAARDGDQHNLKIIESIATKTDLFIEVGGGARDEQSVQRYLNCGVNRVIIGSMAIENTPLMLSIAKRHPGNIAAGIDAKDGFIAIHGWREITDVNAFDFISKLPENGVNTVVYTDISRDGMLKGPNFAAYEKLACIEGLDVIASGGVSRISDVEALASIGIHAAIVGKALYTGAISLTEAINAAQGGKV